MRRLTFESCETVSQDEFAAWCRQVGDDHHYELLNGRVVREPPAGWPHGRVGARIVARLVAALGPMARGEVFDASQGFELQTGDTVEPDVSFVTAGRLAAAPGVDGRFLQLAPDLVVEVLSPGNAWRDRGEKKAIYERAGVCELWLVDTVARRITVFARDGDRFDRGTVYDGGRPVVSAVLPGADVTVDGVLP